MFDFSAVISQVPVNSYVVIGCCVTGWVMKKFLPADNKIIPLVLTVLGAVLLVMIEGFSVQSIVLGAAPGCICTLVCVICLRGSGRIRKPGLQTTSQREREVLEADQPAIGSDPRIRCGQMSMCGAVRVPVMQRSCAAL